jgi:hypothetical protein
MPAPTSNAAVDVSWAAKTVMPALRLPDRVDAAHRQHGQGFQPEAGERIDRHLFAHQAVGAEGGGEEQRYPGQAAERDDFVDDGGHGKAD